MAPADVLQRTPTVSDIYCLVADVAEVAGAEAAKDLENFPLAGGANQAGNGRVGRPFVPIVHGLNELLPGLLRSRHGRFVYRPHRPITLAHIAGLRLLEIIQGPEDREPTIRIRRGETGQVRGRSEERRVGKEWRARRGAEE